MTAADFVSRIFEFIRVIFIAKFFTVAEFGLYSLSVDTAIFFGGLIMPNISGVVLHFFGSYHKKDSQKARQLFSSIVLLTLIKGLIISVVIIFLTKIIAFSYYKKPELESLLIVSIVLITLQPLSDVLNQFLLSLEKFSNILISKIAFSLINLAALVFFYFQNKGTVGIIYALIISYFIQIVINLVPLRKYFSLVAPSLSREIWLFWRPMIAATIFKNITANLPSIIIGRLLDTFQVGIFKIADKSVRAGFSILEPYMNTVSTISINAFHESKAKFLALMNFHNKYTVCLLILMGGIGISGANFFFAVIYGDQYNTAIPIFVFLIISGILGTVNIGFPRTIYFAYNQTVYYLWFTILYSSLQIVLIIFLTAYYQIWGLIAALNLGRLFGLGINIIFTKKIEPQFSVKNLTEPLSWFAAIYVLLYLADKNLDLGYFISGITGTLIFLLIMIKGRYFDINKMISIIKSKKI